MCAVGTVMAYAAVAVHGVVELLQDRKLVAGIFFAYFQLVGFTQMGFGKRIAVVAAGGNTDRHGFVVLFLRNLPKKEQ
ncbi:hypothetical protein GCM10027454_29510 [Algoriphagus aestuariicola]|jgi:hypothetical protein